MVHYDFIKQRAKELRYTTEMISKQLGITRTSFSQKLNKKTEFTASELVKLAHILKCSMTKIITK